MGFKILYFTPFLRVNFQQAKSTDWCAIQQLHELIAGAVFEVFFGQTIVPQSALLTNFQSAWVSINTTVYQKLTDKHLKKTFVWKLVAEILAFLAAILKSGTGATFWGTNTYLQSKIRAKSKFFTQRLLWLCCMNIPKISHSAPKTLKPYRVLSFDPFELKICREAFFAS